MRNIFNWVLFVVAMGMLTTSCSSSETYADKLKSERKNINAFLGEKEIELLDTYPENGVFKENQYFRDPDTGVYINVVDSGNGNRAKTDQMAQVYFRFWDTATLPVASSTISTSLEDQPGVQPVSFTYGNSNSYINSNQNDYFSYIYLSPGVTVPLKYVGEGAVVKLIVPFAQGSTYQNLAYQAMYYGRLKYTKIIN